MHDSIRHYIAHLQEKERSALTLKPVRGEVVRFVFWWKAARKRPFDPLLLARTT